MTLEDFFTLTELKDGLTDPDRVNNLITVMQKQQKDYIVKNFTEATQQWSTVANTIAATENKDCLDLFINLDGLSFIDNWINDAQKLENKNENENSFFEESVTVLLKALERLPVDAEKSMSSGIMRTVQNLVSNSSLMIRKKAKELCDRWVSPKDVIKLENNIEESKDQTMQLESSDTIDKVTVNNEETPNQDPLSKSISEDTVLTEACVCEMDKHVKDAKEDIEIECRETYTLSKPSEQIASSADINGGSGSSAIKTDPKDDKDEDMVENGSQNLPAESSKTSSSSESDNESDDSKKHDDVQSNEDSGNGSRFFNLSMNTRGHNASDMELDYGIVDPLEVARQVAIEVEREIDSRERSCSTSNQTSRGGIERANTPDSINGKNESPPEPVKDPETLISELENCKKPNITASQVSEVAQESERGFSGFDLNQEVCSEEVDDPINLVSTTASRAAAATGSPIGPLQFEGTLGWKGSASTSAFRRVPEADKTLSNSKKRSDCLDFDLNVAEGSEESCVEASFKRPERPFLDLNTLVDQNGIQSPSRSSSSSSKQPCVRNTGLNLNDEPFFASLDHNPYFGKSSKQESVISIFGTKVEVKCDNFVPESMNYGKYGPTHNGFAPGPAMFLSHIPYMVDPRGLVFSEPPRPLMVNMDRAGTSSGSQNNFDLNAGLMVDEEYSRKNSPIVGQKRGEHDGGWELFPISKHHHQQPPWR